MIMSSIYFVTSFQQRVEAITDAKLKNVLLIHGLVMGLIMTDEWARKGGSI